jgi:hypothetical protein
LRILVYEKINFLENKMAQLKNVVFGFPTGKAGDLVFKVRDGKPYFSLKPAEYIRKDEERWKKNKEDFAFSSALSSAIYDINILRNKWENFNRIMKVNYPIVKENASIENVLLTPSGGEFPLVFNNFIFTEENITAELNAFEYQFPYGTRISLQGVMHLSDPEDDNLKKNTFIPVVSKDYDYNNAAITVNIIFNSQETEKIKKYSGKEIILNAAVKLHPGREVRFSESVFSRVINSHL